MAKKRARRRGPPPPTEPALAARWPRLAAAAGRAAGPLWLAATAAGVWSLLFRVLLNSDLWFHLAAGRLIWRERAIPATDSWSFTAAGRPWHNHEWLADVVYHLWASALGLRSLVYWQWALLGGAYLLLYRLLLRRGGNRAWACALTLLAAAVGSPFYDIRPNLYSVLGFVLVVALTLERPRPSWWLPLLLLVWMNLHGGAVLGLMTLAVTLLAGVLAEGEEAGPWRERARRGAALWLACAAATLVNPWGWRAYALPLLVATAKSTPSRTTLYEWLPPWVPGGLESPLYPWAIGAGVVAALVLLASARRNLRRQPPLAALGLFALTLAMSLQSRRFVPFLGIAAALLAAEAVRAARERRRGAPAARASEPVRRPLASATAALAVLLVGLWRLAPYPLGPRAFDLLSWASRMPVENVTFLEANGIRGDVFTEYLWGGYLAYRSDGRLRVHADPRAETVFDAETLRAHFRIQDGTPGWRDALLATGADLVLWPMDTSRHREMGRELAGSPRWRRLHRDGVSLLLARSDRPLPSPLRPTPESGQSWWAAGREAMDERRYAEAAGALERALAADPALLPACEALAVSYAMLDDRGATARTVARCQRIFPTEYLSTEGLFADRGRGGG